MSLNTIYIFPACLLYNIYNFPYVLEYCVYMLLYISLYISLACNGIYKDIFYMVCPAIYCTRYDLAYKDILSQDRLSDMTWKTHCSCPT